MSLGRGPAEEAREDTGAFERRPDGALGGIIHGFIITGLVPTDPTERVFKNSWSERGVAGAWGIGLDASLGFESSNGADNSLTADDGLSPTLSAFGAVGGLNTKARGAVGGAFGVCIEETKGDVWDCGTGEGWIGDGAGGANVDIGDFGLVGAKEGGANVILPNWGTATEECVSSVNLVVLSGLSSLLPSFTSTEDGRLETGGLRRGLPGRVGRSEFGGNVESSGRGSGGCLPSDLGGPSLLAVKPSLSSLIGLYLHSSILSL
jgi:hypothetical protein